MPEDERGLYLRLREEETSLTVEAAAVVPRWSRSLLRAPMLTTEILTPVVTAGSETVLNLLDEKGGVVGSFGFPGLPPVFFDRKAPGGRGLTGRTGDPTQKVREISVPLRDAARFLFFYRSRITLVTEGVLPHPTLRQHAMALYSTAGPGQRSLPPPPLPLTFLPDAMAVERLPWLPPASRPDP
jgi:hypothetical protein